VRLRRTPHLVSFFWLLWLVAQGSLIALMMEAALTSETSVDIYLTTRQYIPEDFISLYSFMFISFFFIFFTLYSPVIGYDSVVKHDSKLIELLLLVVVVVVAVAVGVQY
jgi:hypothetical protein